MQDNTRWFVQALRDACDHALKDGMIGNQTGHIESIKVTYAGSPMELEVTCFGAYSPTEAQRVHKNLGIIHVMDLVARYLADRAVGLKESFDDLR
jgi:hypothetical protein